MFRTEPEPGLTGRSLAYPRGKVTAAPPITSDDSRRGQAADYYHLRQARPVRLGWDDVKACFPAARRPFSSGRASIHGIAAAADRSPKLS